MPIVCIYVSTDLKGPRKRRGKYLYILQFVSSGGKKAELTAGDVEDGVTENSMYLTALLHALRRLNRPCNLHIHIDNPYFRNTYLNGWPQEWKKNGWRKADGSVPANMDLWRQILAELKEHIVVLEPAGKHEFSGWMRMELAMEEKNYVKKYHAL